MDIRACIDSNTFLASMDPEVRAWVERLLAEPQTATNPAATLMNVLGALLAVAYGSGATTEQRLSLMVTLAEALAEGMARAVAADLATSSEWLAHVKPANSKPC